MKPYIEIIATQEYNHYITVEYVVHGCETIEDAELMDIDKEDLLTWMNADLPCDLYTKDDITNETIKQYLTEKVL